MHLVGCQGVVGEWNEEDHARVEESITGIQLIENTIRLGAARP